MQTCKHAVSKILVVGIFDTKNYKRGSFENTEQIKQAVRNRNNIKLSRVKVHLLSINSRSQFVGIRNYALRERRCSQQLHAMANPSEEDVALPSSSMTIRLLEKRKIMKKLHRIKFIVGKYCTEVTLKKHFA